MLPAPNVTCPTTLQGLLAGGLRTRGEAWWMNGFAALIVRTVQGENMFTHPRTPETLPPPIAPLLEAELAEEQALQMKLEDWLAHRWPR